MTRLGTEIREARKRLGWTQNDLATRVGCSVAQLSLMESGRRRTSESWATRLEEAFGMRPGFLVDIVRWGDVPPSMRDEVNAARNVAEQLRRAARSGTDLDALYHSGDLHALVERLAVNVSDPLPVRQIPVINNVQAGYPREFTDLDYPASVADEYVGCPDITDPNAFGARVVGDSMEPDYREGDLVIFSPNTPTAPGSDCFVRLERDNETTFKRIFMEDDGASIRLQPLNSTYSPRIVPREAITGMYPAVYALKRVLGA